MCLRLYIVYVIFQFSSTESTNSTQPTSTPYYVPRIIGGQKARRGDVPYQVAFKVRTSKMHHEYTTFCGGSLLSPRKILSAAHCFEQKDLLDCTFFSNEKRVKRGVIRRTVAVAGNLNNVARFPANTGGSRTYGKKKRTTTVAPALTDPSGGQWRWLENGVYPSNYRFPKADIAMITVRVPFQFNLQVNKIPISSRHIEYQMPCLASGYGRLSHREPPVQSAYLFMAYMDIVPTAYCNKMHRQNMAHFVCSTSRIPDTAKGDSGGPLVCKGTGDRNERGNQGILVGVVSGHRIGVGSFFTRVSSYRKFINKHSSATTTSNLNVFVVLIIYVVFCPF